MTHLHKHLLFSFATILIFGLGFLVWHSQISNAQTKLTYPEINTALNSKLPNKVFKNKAQLINWLIKQIEQRGVDKPLTADREDDLRQAGATDELIEAIRENSPPLPSTPTPTPIKTPVSTPIPTPTPTTFPTPTPTPTSSNLSKNSIGMEFVRLSRASFTMGSEDGEADEKPIHRVTISKDFWMGKTEVTQGQWKAVMGNNPSSFKDCGDNCPVENVSWEDVQDFITKLNRRGEGTYRLPTEAEWEYACRANSITKYSYGNGESSLDAYAWYAGNSGSKTHQVATKQPNDWGLYDMHGNVWEWTQDWYGAYSSGSVTDPQGATSGSFRVGRGGGWGYAAVGLRSAYRGSIAPSNRYDYLGFRLLRTQ